MRAGDYLSAEALWLANTTVSPARPSCLLIWLHPYSYNTGYSPQYGQADVRGAVARQAGCVVMAFDQVCGPYFARSHSPTSQLRLPAPKVLKIGRCGTLPRKS